MMLYTMVLFSHGNLLLVAPDGGEMRQVTTMPSDDAKVFTGCTLCDALRPHDDLIHAARDFEELRDVDGRAWRFAVRRAPREW